MTDIFYKQAILGLRNLDTFNKRVVLGLRNFDS